MQQKLVSKPSCDEVSVQEEEGLSRLVSIGLSRPAMGDQRGGEGDGRKVCNTKSGNGLVH